MTVHEIAPALRQQPGARHGGISSMQDQPNGLCRCGCGQRTQVHKGRPRDYVNSHGRRGPAAQRLARIASHRAQWDDAGLPYGLCLCGCGLRTPVSPASEFAKGWIQGEPRMWIPQHDKRQAPQQYLVEDRGYATPCWIWQWTTTENGYGVLGSKGLAHRLFYEERFGPIPTGLHLDHLCRQRPCVNPEHLEAVTQTENNRRQPNQKLSLDKARVIRAEFGSWRLSRWSFCRGQALRYGVHPTSIDYVLADRTWREDV